jgi:hypothetical protein
MELALENPNEEMSITMQKRRYHAQVVLLRFAKFFLSSNPSDVHQYRPNTFSEAIFPKGDGDILSRPSATTPLSTHHGPSSARVPRQFILLPVSDSDNRRPPHPRGRQL